MNVRERIKSIAPTFAGVFVCVYLIASLGPGTSTASRAAVSAAIAFVVAGAIAPRLEALSFQPYRVVVRLHWKTIIDRFDLTEYRKLSESDGEPFTRYTLTYLRRDLIFVKELNTFTSCCRIAKNITLDELCGVDAWFSFMRDVEGNFEFRLDVSESHLKTLRQKKAEMFASGTLVLEGRGVVLAKLPANFAWPGKIETWTPEAVQQQLAAEGEALATWGWTLDSNDAETITSQFVTLHRAETI
jgi:hypothetical protein